MRKLLLLSISLAGLAFVTGCTIHETETPPLTGPSEFAQSVTVTATPDSIALNGQQSSVVVQAFDATGSAAANVSLRLEVYPFGCGALSRATAVTGSDGRATAVFTAPSLPLPMPECSGFSPGDEVLVAATPIGSNYQTARTSFATIQLVMPTVIAAPGGPTPNFSFNPLSPKANAVVTFNGSTSTAGPGRTLVGYQWDFGDGTLKSGPIVTHDFVAGTYLVVLTVTDDIGQQALKGASINVVP
jgi:hypothetical protein